MPCPSHGRTARLSHRSVPTPASAPALVFCVVPSKCLLRAKSLGAKECRIGNSRLILLNLMGHIILIWDSDAISTFIFTMLVLGESCVTSLRRSESPCSRHHGGKPTGRTRSRVVVTLHIQMSKFANSPNLIFLNPPCIPLCCSTGLRVSKGRGDSPGMGSLEKGARSPKPAGGLGSESSFTRGRVVLDLLVRSHCNALQSFPRALTAT